MKFTKLFFSLYILGLLSWFLWEKTFTVSYHNATLLKCFNGGYVFALPIFFLLTMIVVKLIKKENKNTLCLAIILIAILLFATLLYFNILLPTIAVVLAVGFIACVLAGFGGGY